MAAAGRRGGSPAHALLAALLVAVSFGCATPGPQPVEAGEPGTGLAPEPRSASLVVRSNVFGDAVAIDGRPLGPTGPDAHALSPGRHTVSVTKPGYGAWKTTVDLLDGETRIVRAVLEPSSSAVAEAAEAGASWNATVEFLREKLRDRWSGGEPPAAFGVTDEGVLGFHVRNPADAAVWHRYSLDVRDIAVVPVDHAPSVVSLRCVDGAPCIRQRICREDQCVSGDFATQYRWFFVDEEQGSKVAQACDHLIELARHRPPPKRPVRELF